MFQNFKKVLIVAPHTDDAEFGCGATISRMVEEGLDVYIATFSACEKSVPSQFPSDILITEFKEASKVLGVKSINIFLYGYEVRIFNEKRQQILQDLIELRNNVNPDLVMIPSESDVHQDHNTIFNESIRAFKFSSILGYEMPWNNLSFETSSFVFLNEKHILSKVNALKRYKSQSKRPYANEEFIRSLARTRGVQINTKYAEAFQVIRWILK
ncbi:MAG: PIG-L family deacetylase [Flavobacteriales bacterium]|nr:PIG-L family deacetylase [Flavobacteriales bacterium]